MNSGAILATAERHYLACTATQRMVLIGLAIVALVAVFDLVWYQDLRNRIAAQERNARSLLADHALLARELDSLELREAEDPNRAVRSAIEAEAERLAILDRQLRERALEILAPEQMKRVLRDLIGGVRALELTSLETETVTALFVGSDDGAPGLFRHGMTLRLEGDYLALVEAVRRIEALPWRFYWSSLAIDADRSPTRRIELRVYTVSLREEWMRV